jgi:hypothetical protein
MEAKETQAACPACGFKATPSDTEGRAVGRAAAPVAYFAFNRPAHTKASLASLASNDLASQTDLFAFVDGARNNEDDTAIEEVCRLLSDARVHFRSLTIDRRDQNVGLANSITAGVTRVVGRYGKLIVCEDDLEVSPVFLRYMNDALDHYKDIKKVWHITGFAETLDAHRPDESFFCRAMNCWGWATWDDRWRHFEKNPFELIKEFSPSMIRRFNLDGIEDWWSQVLANANGTKDTWAIFWYATIFQKNGLCLQPYNSFVRNNGWDGTGVNCPASQSNGRSAPLNPAGVFTAPAEVAESEFGVSLLKQFFCDQAKAQRDEAIASRAAALVERDAALAQRDAALRERDTALGERDAMLSSTAWRLTKPLRDFKELMAARPKAGQG